MFCDGEILVSVAFERFKNFSRTACGLPEVFPTFLLSITTM
jgi:hypothetical protein